MDRREALKKTSWILGFSISASAVASVMSGCTAEAIQVDSDVWNPVFFDTEEADLVAELADTIFPKTKTPGAKDVLVHQYIDLMLKDHYQLRDQKEFRRGLGTVRSRSIAKFGTEFTDLSYDQKRQLLESIETEAHRQMDEGAVTLARLPFFYTLKELTYIGYFTSETIGEQYLSYDPIPGAYDGCVPLEEIGNSSSL